MSEPEKPSDATPEKAATAETAPVEQAVPIPVAPSVAEPVVAPLEVSQTAPTPSEIPAVPTPAPVPDPAPDPVPVPAPPLSTGPSPDFDLAPEAVPARPLPPILPSPAEAALQAARIVSEMVDIDSESGAVIAATAAAGAAIGAAVAAQPNDPNSPISATASMRLSRERILRALEEQPASLDDAPPDAPLPRMPRATTAPGDPQPRATTADDGAYEIDPVAIAAAAIGRLRARARTDLAELRVHYHRHDVFVILAALAILVGAGRLHARLVTPPNVAFPPPNAPDHGLAFEHAAGWLGPDFLPPVAPRLVHEVGGVVQTVDESAYHVELSGTGTAKIEVLIDKKPGYSNIITGLELDRRTRWGELYTLEHSAVVPIAGHDWLRTEYRYAHASEKGDAPTIDRAIEYATIDRDQIYVVTLFGTPGELSRIEDVVAPSLRVQSQTGLPLVPETSRVSQHTYPTGVGSAFRSTVMIVVADLVGGRLRARGGGSGVIVGRDGSILTNYHVLHDKEDHLHHVFVVGRFEPDKPPQLWCAGHPSRSKLQPELDLALVKCDMDLDGRTWNPASSATWAPLPLGHATDVKIGQRLWVLGYPDVGGGGLTLSEGEVQGFSGADGTAGEDFIKTDASITRGNSGGPVVDDGGRLVGVASAFRTKIVEQGTVIETAQVGLVRPIGKASCLLDVAATGWTPAEGKPGCDLAPRDVEAAVDGTRIYTTVVDDANESPIRSATVMVLRPGIKAAAIDTNRLDEQAIAWGKTNAEGEVRLKQLVPVPGTYTVLVVAPGYEPLIGESELHLDASSPPRLDPWSKKIHLHAR